MFWFSFLNFVTCWFFFIFNCALLVNFVTSLLCIIFLCDLLTSFVVSLLCVHGEFHCFLAMHHLLWALSLPCYALLVSFVVSLLCLASLLWALGELCVVSLMCITSCCALVELWQLHLMYHFDPVWCSLSLPCAFDCLLVMHSWCFLEFCLVPFQIDPSPNILLCRCGRSFCNFFFNYQPNFK